MSAAIRRRIARLAQRHVDTSTLDVRWWGAAGDGRTDDTRAIRAAVAARKALGPGTVYFPRPPVAYVIQPHNYAYSTSFPVWSACIDIDFSNVTVRGDPGGSTLRLRTPGGGNPAVAFSLVDRDALDADGPSSPAAPVPIWNGPGHFYGANARVRGPNGHQYITTSGGMSGSIPPTDLSAATSGGFSDGGVTWILYDFVFRGNMFRVKSYAVNSDPGPSNIVFENLIFDGAAPYRADLHGAFSTLASSPLYASPWNRPSYLTEPGYNANPLLNGTMPAGQGWVTPFGHAPIVMPGAGNYNMGAITFDSCVFTGWRSEVLYVGNSPGKITIRGGRITDCTADGVSIAAPMLVEDLEIDNVSQGVENDPYTYDQTFRRLHVHDVSQGITFPSQVASYDNRGMALIEDCNFERCHHYAAAFQSYAANVTFRRNRIVDCNRLHGLSGAGAIWIREGAGSVKNILISDCDFIVDSSAGRGVVAIGRIVASSGNRIERCRFTRTPKAVTSGQRWLHSVQVSAKSTAEWTISDCDCRGATLAPQAYGDVASLYDPLPIRIERCRTDGLVFEAIVAPYLDPRGYLDFTVAPPGPVVLTAARGFVLGAPTRIVINGNVTVQASAAIVLAGETWAPGAPGGEAMFIRPVAAPGKVYEVPGTRMGYT